MALENFVAPFLQGLRMAADMAWQTWWALVLGFTIAGVVEAYADEETMTDVLGGSGPREVALGTFFGAISSSCSFGAIATAKSLFKKGASAAASLAAFQFASTNLVIELGLVMWILLGWQFVAANFVSGLLLIVLLAAIYRFLVPDTWIEAAREHVRAEGDGGHHCHGDEEDEGPPPAAWRQACRRALGEWRMLWKEILAGFLIAGWIGAFVPRETWTALFSVAPTGSLTHVVVTSMIGVFVGVITFVCSVGNVPFALLLWKNGIAFGAVMSFIFADLIVPHIVMAYRRFYGARMAAVMFAATAVSAVIAGVAIHYAWTALGWIPPPGQLGGTAPEGYTGWLNGIFTLVLLGQVAATRT